MGRLKSYKTLVVDDNDLARADLIDLLAEHPQVAVVGEAGSVRAAKQAIRKLNPDLIFLDIQFPGESGFDLLEQQDIGAKIIFVTAFDEYAIRAFQVNALDYLLKPVNPDRLAQALERLDNDGRPALKTAQQLEYDDLLFLEMDGKFHFQRVNAIVKIAAAGMYTEVTNTGGRKGLIYKSMKDWEQRLPVKWFLRIHRSTIINVEYVDRIEEWFNGNYHVYLRGAQEPEMMSRRHVARLKEIMQ